MSSYCNSKRGSIIARLLGWALIAGMIFGISPTQASTDIWTGASDANWNTAGNWTGGNSPPLSGDVLVFDGNTNTAANNDFTYSFTGSTYNGKTFNGITFAPTAGSFSLGGNSFVLAGDINDNSTNPQTISFTQGGPTGPNYGLVLNGATTNVNVVSGGSLSIGQLTFGNNPLYVNNATASAAQSTAVSTLNINSNNVSIGNLVVQTNTAASNVMNIASGVTLNMSGLGNNGSIVVIGTPPILTTNSADTSNLTVNGSGTWNISNTNSNFTFGVGSGNNNTTAMNPTLDMSGLSNFVYNTGAAGTGSFNVGFGTRPNGTLRLANTSNVITAASMEVGDSNQTPGFTNLGSTNNNASGTVNLFLGTGTNVLNLGSGVAGVQQLSFTIPGDASATQFGLILGNNKGVGAIQFQGSTGSVVIAGQTGGASKTNIVVGRESSGSGSTALNQLLLAGHQSTVQGGTVIIAANGGSSGASNGIGTFDTGSFTADNFQIGVRTGGTGAVTGTFFVGASTTVGSTTATPNPSATGVFTVNTTFAMTNQTTANTATATFGVYGGTANINTDIVNLSTAGTNTCTVIVAGGTLDMTGHSIGTTAAPITLTFTGGTLRNLNEFNGGSASLTKTDGTAAILAGTNNYSGSTEVNGGTLLVNGSLKSTGAVNLNTGALGGIGSVGNVTAMGSTTLRPGATALDGSIGTLTMNSLNFSGDYRFDTLGASTSDRLVINGATIFNGGTLTPGSIGGAGTFTLVSSPNAAITYNPQPTLNAPSGTRSTFTPHFNSNAITVDVVGSALTDFWTGTVNDGSGNFQWDVNATSNWNNGASADKFFNLDTATFDDAHVTGSRNVTLNA